MKTEELKRLESYLNSRVRKAHEDLAKMRERIQDANDRIAELKQIVEMLTLADQGQDLNI